MKLTSSVLAVVLLCTFLLAGCSVEQKAQKLFDQKKYEEILSNPEMKNLPIAGQARVKLAERLLAEGKFEDVWNRFRDTPAAAQAKTKVALQYFKDKKYQMLLDSFPDSPFAGPARIRLTDTTRHDTSQQANQDVREKNAQWWLDQWKHDRDAGKQSAFGAQEQLRRLCVYFDDTNAGREACQMYRDLYHEDPAIPLPQ